MSETLSAEELAYLNEMHGPDYPVNTLPPVRRMLATIEALQAEVTTLRTALEKTLEDACDFRHEAAREALHGRE